MDRTELEKLPEPVREAYGEIQNLIAYESGNHTEARKLILVLRRMHLQTKLETMEEIR